MSDPGPSQPRLTDHEDAEIARYRALSASAMAGLLLGLLSPLALLAPPLWSVPLLGILVSGWALGRIARNASALAGWKAALAGLLLAMLFLAAAATDRIAYRLRVCGQAQRFAFQWFEFLAGGHPQKAFQLKLHPRLRRRFDEQLWDFYRDDPHWQKKLKDYVRPGSLPRTLLALKDKARIRYCRTTNHDQFGDRDRVDQVYAVTFDEDGRRKTFLVGMRLQRVKLPEGRANWQVLSAGSIRRDQW